MGVTIHFEGRVKTPTAYRLLIDELHDFAAIRGWPCEDISESQTTLKRVRDEKDWDYSGPTFGVQLHPDENADPLRFEFDRDYYLQEFVKTQFAGTATHIVIIDLLKRIEPFFERFIVEDEGEFWETSDESALARHIQRCDEVLQEMLAKHPGARGPVRLASGRIVDFMS